MLLPNSIELNARTITVLKSPEPFEQVTEDSYVLGYYAPRKGEIGIYDCPSNPTVTESLFFHEIIEAIDMHGDMGLDHNSITILGNSMHQVFKQVLEHNMNPPKIEAPVPSFKEVVTELEKELVSKTEKSNALRSTLTKKDK